MRNLWLITGLLLSFNLYASPLEQGVMPELPKIAEHYADGYAKLVKDSLKVKLLYQNKEGECILNSSFRMEGFGSAPNFTQFIGFFNCPSFHQLVKPNKKLFLSDVYRFFIGEPELDIATSKLSPFSSPAMAPAGGV